MSTGSESAEVTIKRLNQELETSEMSRRTLESKLAAADMAKETASRMTVIRLKLDESERRLQKSGKSFYVQQRLPVIPLRFIQHV